jgi:hypothetical protein
VQYIENFSYYTTANINCGLYTSICIQILKSILCSIIIFKTRGLSCAKLMMHLYIVIIQILPCPTCDVDEIAAGVIIRICSLFWMLKKVLYSPRKSKAVGIVGLIFSFSAKKTFRSRFQAPFCFPYNCNQKEIKR